MSMLFTFVAALVCLAQASIEPTCTTCAEVDRQADVAGTGGAALLQVADKVGKRLVEELDEGANGTANGTERVKVVDEKKKKKGPKDDFSFNNNDNLNTGNNNDALEENNNVDNAALSANIDNSNLNNLNNNNDDKFTFNNNDNSDITATSNDNFDFTKDKSVKKLMEKKKKHDEKTGTDEKTDGFNFGSNNNDNAGQDAGSKGAIDNFDFGEGKLKEKGGQAVEWLKKDVGTAVSKVQKALDDVEQKEQVMLDAINELAAKSEKDIQQVSDKLQSGLSDVQEKVRDAQEELKELQKQVGSAAHPGCLPATLVMAAAVSLGFSLVY